jgi:hypothetical protein
MAEDVHTTSSKRKRVVLTLAQKREVIRRLDAGEKPGALALAFSVSRQQISDVKRSRGRLARTVDTIEEDFVCQKRKSLKTAKKRSAGPSIVHVVCSGKGTGYSSFRSNDTSQGPAVQPKYGN